MLVPLSETTNIALLEGVIGNQTEILQKVYNSSDVSAIPQIWALCKFNYMRANPYECASLTCLFVVDKEVEGYYDDGMRVPDYVTLLWSDDKYMQSTHFPNQISQISLSWGNIRRLPTVAERNRTGGAGIYYHVCLLSNTQLLEIF